MIIIPNFSCIYTHALGHICRATVGGAYYPVMDVGFWQVTYFSQCNVSRSNIIRNFNHAHTLCLFSDAVMIFHENMPPGSQQFKENKKTHKADLNSTYIPKSKLAHLRQEVQQNHNRFTAFWREKKKGLYCKLLRLWDCLSILIYDCHNNAA